MPDSEREISEAIKAKLSAPIREIEFSVRTHNVLARERINSVRDLVQLSEQQLLEFRGFGQKSLREVKNYLRPGLKLGMRQSDLVGFVVNEVAGDRATAGEPPSPVEVGRGPEPQPLSSLPKSTRLRLAARVSDIHFSTRTHNVLVGSKIVFVGDLVQLRERELLTLSGFGRKSLNEIKKFLQPDLRLGISIAGWSRQSAAELEKEYKDELETRRRSDFVKAIEHGRPPACLEEELQRLAEVLSSNARRAAINFSFFGWDGHRAKTLEETGRLFGITRERVRQVTTQFQNRLLSTDIELKWLRKASDVMFPLIPGRTQSIENKLLSSGIIRKPFHLSGLIAAFQLASMNLGSALLTSVNGTEFLLPSSEANMPREILRRARRSASKYGCCSIEEIADEVRSNFSAQFSTSFVADVIRTEAGYRSLADGEWFWLADRPRNRLLNILRKVFSVSRKVHLGELRTALYRHRRMSGFSPPRKVLREVISQLAGCRVVEDVAVCAAPSQPDRELSPLELLFLSAFEQHGPVLNREALERILLKQGVNRTSFYIYLGYSPIITRLKPGVYSLIGADIPPGLVEDASSKLTRPKVVMGSGWRKDGTLWICYRLTHMYLGSGAFTVPSAHRALLQGTYLIRSEDGAEFGTATVRDNFLYGFSKFFKRRGGEPDDYLIVIFNLQSRIVTALIGDADLFERFEVGEDLPELDVVDQILSDVGKDVAELDSDEGVRDP